MEITKKLLHKLYTTDQNSVAIIARQLGCSEHKVNYWIAKYKIPKRSISESVYLHHNPEGDPFKILAPVTIREALLYGLGVGLYWGEGTKSNKTTVRLGNTDPKLVKKFVEFLVKICGIKKDKMRFGLQVFNDMDPREALRFWQKELEVYKTQFFPKVVITPARSLGNYRQKSKYGVLTVYYGNRKLRDVLCQMIEDVK